MNKQAIIIRRLGSASALDDGMHQKRETLSWLAPSVTRHDGKVSVLNLQSQLVVDGTTTVGSFPG